MATTFTTVPPCAALDVGQPGEVRSGGSDTGRTEWHQSWAEYGPLEGIMLSFMPLFTLLLCKLRGKAQYPDLYHLF